MGILKLITVEYKKNNDGYSIKTTIGPLLSSVGDPDNQIKLLELIKENLCNKIDSKIAELRKDVE